MGRPLQANYDMDGGTAASRLAACFNLIMAMEDVEIHARALTEEDLQVDIHGVALGTYTINHSGRTEYAHPGDTIHVVWRYVYLPGSRQMADDEMRSRYARLGLEYGGA